MNDTPDPDSPELLVSVPTEFEASAIVAALAEQGIEATMTGGFTAGFLAEAPGDVAVAVKQEDLEKAKIALVNIHKENENIDWDNVDVGEPEDT